MSSSFANNCLGFGVTPSGNYDIEIVSKPYLKVASGSTPVAPGAGAIVYYNQGGLPFWADSAGTAHPFLYGSAVTEVIGTPGQIDVIDNYSTPIISIDPGYIGQSSINTVGSLLYGSWQAETIGIGFGGTGVTSTPADGQLLIGNGSGYTLNTLTAGSGVAITNGVGVITISATGTGGTVTSVAGDSSTITTSPNPITTTGTISIASTYSGQTSINTLGTIGTGIWKAGTIGAAYGGTGVNNGSNIISVGGNLITSGAFNLTFTTTNTTNVTLPTSGTLATVAQLPTPAALTAASDTNITLTLAGTPATALLQSASITAGWSGFLSVARGGTGLVTIPTNGQILIGNGTNYTLANLSAGSGVTIANTAGAITISATGSGGTVTNLTAGSNIVLSPSPITTTGSIGVVATPTFAGLNSSSNILPTIDGAYELGSSTAGWYEVFTNQVSSTNNTLQLWGNTGSINGECDVFGSYTGAGIINIRATNGSSASGTLNISANASTGSGTITVIGGNNSSSPLINNTVSISGGGSSGGYLQLFGGQSGTQSNNSLKIGSSSYGQTVVLYGSLALNAFGAAGVVHNSAAGLLSSSLISLTSDITGILPLANGGTGVNLTASNGGIFYSTGSTGAILSGTSTANQILLSGASAAPIWSTATYPASTTINQLLYSSANNTIAGLATANSSILVTSSGGVPSLSTTLPNFSVTQISGISGAHNIYASTSSGTVGALNIYANNTSGSGTVNIVGAPATGGNAGIVNIYGNNSASGTNSSVVIYGNSAGTSGSVTLQGGNGSTASTNFINMYGGGSNGGTITISGASGGMGTLYLSGMANGSSAGTVSIFGGAGGTTCAVTIQGAYSAFSGSTAGAVNIYGGNTSTSPLSNNVVNIQAGGSAGGTLSLSGAASSTQANNIVAITGGASQNGYINIGSSSYNNPVRFYSNSNSNRILDFSTITSQGIWFDGYGNIHGNSSIAGTNWNVNDVNSNGIININIGGAAGQSSLYGGNSTSNTTSLLLYGNNAGNNGTLVLAGGKSNTGTNNVVQIGLSGYDQAINFNVNRCADSLVCAEFTISGITSAANATYTLSYPSGYSVTNVKKIEAVIYDSSITQTIAMNTSTAAAANFTVYCSSSAINLLTGPSWSYSGNATVWIWFN